MDKEKINDDLLGISDIEELVKVRRELKYHKNDNVLYRPSELYIFQGSEGYDICYKEEDSKRSGIYRFYNVINNDLVLKLSLKYIPKLTLEVVFNDLGFNLAITIDKKKLLELMLSLVSELDNYVYSSEKEKYVYVKSMISY